jgi:hypothetical protein
MSYEDKLLNLYEKATILSKSIHNSINYIDVQELPNSGTGYLYPKKCNQSIVFIRKWIDIGFIVKIEINRPNMEPMITPIIIYRHKEGNLTAYSGHSIIHDDCIVRHWDEKFYLNVNTLLDGKILEIGDIKIKIYTEGDGCDDNETSFLTVVS